jgi:flavin reductase (DIM6/NTAB) family NADH-FMN oxidoreductase RutF
VPTQRKEFDMPMKTVESIGKLYVHFPRLVTVAGLRADGKDNLIPLAWFTPISFDPPLLGILVAPKRHSHDMIAGAGSFTLNFLPFEMAERVKDLGSTSGRDIDKFETFSLKKAEAESVDAPIMADAYGALECKVVDQRSYGDHTLFVGEIVRGHYREEAFDENRTLDIPSTLPVLYLGKDHYVTVDPGTRRWIAR